MTWKQRILSNMFLRNMLADLWARSSDTNRSPVSISYFQYKLGKYQSDYFLYFPTEPYSARYKNEIFNKLNEYSGYEIPKFLDFHFQSFSDKADFLNFLSYELKERLTLNLSKSKEFKLESALAWVEVNRQDLQRKTEKRVRDAIGGDTQSVIQDQGFSTAPNSEAFAKGLSDKLSEHMTKVMSETEKGLKDLTGAFSTGTIQLNNHNHEDKLIQLLILIQQIQAPPEQARGEQLFKKFTASDIASILHLHFEAFRDNKLNTIQRKVGDQIDRIKPNNPRIKDLSAALQTFFY